MLQGRKIAVFIDVDNTEMDYESYKNAMAQVGAMGEIVCATVYGASERKQKGVIDDAKQKGYSVQLPARSRKRIRKVFDDRIWVDVTDLVAHNNNIDTVAVIAIPTDMVYLFSYLRRLGLQCVGCDSLDEASRALVADTVMVQVSDIEKAPRRHAERAKNVSAKINAGKTAQTESKKTVASTEETKDLLREIDKLRGDFSSVADTPAAAEAAPVTEAVSQSPAKATTSENLDSSDLIGKIEEMYKTEGASDDDELVAEIQKLLAGLD